MSDIDNIENGGDDVDLAAAATAAVAEDLRGAPAAACLSCGNAVTGPFCSWCGQKDDDLRRSSFILARDFMRDTFGFDSRMWRTLGLMAIAPGLVPKNYAHGRRSRFTPPVRMFIVVSFFFFAAIAATNTLFLGVEVRKSDPVELEAALAELPPSTAAAVEEELQSPSLDCDMKLSFRFFTAASELEFDQELWDACIERAREAGRASIAEADVLEVGEPSGDIERERAEAEQWMNRALASASWIVSDPRALNNSFNNWLPRVLFVMTPVLAFILTLFIRGRDALIFDHLILSFYTHATAFAIIASALILAQFGVPYTGIGAFVAIAVYYFIALKRAYGRGWVKTVWTAFVSGLVYWTILLIIVMAIVANIIWQAST